LQVPHPKERPSGLPAYGRREFLGRSVGTALSLSSLSAILAACQKRSPSEGASGASEVPLARPGSPVTLPLYDDNAAIADGMSAEEGPLLVYNWNDYIYKKVLKRWEDETGVEIKYTQFTGMSEAISKIQNDTLEFDLFFPTPDHLRSLVLAKRIKPLNLSYLPNFQANAWPQIQSPFYDQESRYTVPYLTWKTGVGYRRDMVDPAPSGDLTEGFGILWDPAYKDLVGVLDEYRDVISTVLLRNGVGDVNATDPSVLQAAGQAMSDWVDATNVKISTSATPDYQVIAEGTRAMHVSWSGNMNYARYYLPEGTSSDVLGFYYPPGGVVGNDIITVSSKAPHPVLAHQFIDFLYDRDNALDNFSYEGYQPPLDGISKSEWLSRGYIPDNLETTIVGAEDFDSGQFISELSAETDQLWQDIWTQFKVASKG
jgi:spermidine/putrescine transport system substrate-binding protein